VVVHPFRAAIEARDIDSAVGLLADDVTFSSPIVFRPYHGREEVRPLLHAVSRVLEDFEYVREMHSDGRHDHALAFQARVGDLFVEGCDFVHEDTDGQIDQLTVMVRPLRAALALAKAMSDLLAGAGRDEAS
jgi:ketosteroid isomerase-like protein